MDKAFTQNEVLQLENEALKRVKKDPWRLKYHLMPLAGWLNDPNGLIEKDGVNHIFFQYTPKIMDSRFPKSWGHYLTKDFINYTYSLPAIYPEHEYDRSGIYSGSTINIDDNLKAYYTGNVKHEGDYDLINEGREQNLVVAEDYNPETNKFETTRLLLKNSDYPEGLTLHVRDPRVLKRDDKLIMLLGARDKNDQGLILVFESEDGNNWEFKNELRSEDELGYMWECPDLASLDGKDFLIVSPQGIESEEEKFQNLYQSGYILVDDFDQNPVLSDFIEFDHGFDFYAPQTYLDENGRRILIGWMGLPDVDYTYPTSENEWYHALTIPRVLTEKEGRLYQSPISELEELRLEEYNYKITNMPFETTVSDAFELILNNPAPEGSIIIRDGCQFKWDNGKLVLDFTYNESTKSAGAGRDKRIARVKSVEKIQIFADTSSLEIFVNDGEIVFSTRFFPKKDDHNLIIDSLNSEVQIFDLDSFKVQRDTGEIIFK